MQHPSRKPRVVETMLLMDRAKHAPEWLFQAVIYANAMVIKP